MGPTNERIDVNTSVAVRGDRGFFFGTLKWVHGERMLVEVDAELEQGEKVEVRVTLGPGPGTALARAEVTRPLVVGKGEHARYVLTVVEVAPSERAALATWVQNAKVRGTYQSFGHISAGNAIAEGMSGATKSETKAALARMDARSGGPPTGPAPDPFGLRSDVTSSGSARTAMRDALRKAIAAPPSAYTSIPPASRAGLPPVPTPSATSLPPISSGAGPATPGGADPTYASTTTRSSAWLEVRWSSPEAFADDVDALLADPRLVLPNLGDALPDREPLRVMLRHASVVLDCPGEIVEHGPFGATYRLALDPLHRMTLQAWRDDYRRK